MNEDTDERIRALVARIDPSGSVEQIAIREEFGVLAGARLPEFILEVFRDARRAKLRATLLIHCGIYARESDAAFDVALLAARDRSRLVRYHGLQMLAFSQRQDRLSDLQDLAQDMPEDSRGDLEAAIYAIQSVEPNHFVDRGGRGNHTFDYG